MGQALGPFDQIRQMSPWNGPKQAQPWDVLQADGVLQFYPWRDLVFESWGRGQVPFWNPYELAGTPLLANSQSAGLYPPHMLLGILHVPTAFAMVLLAWFHLALAGLGAYFLSRQLGASRVGGAVAGLSFSLSAFMIAWTGLPSVITTVAWIPWLLAFIIRAYKLDPLLFNDVELETGAAEEDPKYPEARVIWLRRLKAFTMNLVWVALSAAMLILAGHLQFVAYGLLAAVLLIAWFTANEYLGGDEALRRVQAKTRLERNNWRGLLPFNGIALLFSLGLGALVASPHLMPVLEYSTFSHRRNTPTEEGYLGYQASAIQPYEMVGIMHPNLVGSPSEPVEAIETEQPLSSYWPGYIKRGGNFAEGAIGLGPLVIGLLFLARRRFDIRRWGGVALIGLLAFLLATGTAAGRMLYFAVPGWSSTGSPGRISVLFVLVMCVLAGVAATQDKEPEPTEKWRMYVPIASMTILALISIYSLMFAMSELVPLQPLNADIFSTILTSATGKPKAMAAISTLIAAISIGYWLKQERRAGWVLILAVFASFFLSVPQVLRWSHSPDLKIEGPKDERVAMMNDAWDIWFAALAHMPPNTASLSRIHELGGYDSLLHRDTVKMLNDVNGQDPAPPANGNMMFVKSTAAPESLGAAGVSEIWSRSPIGVKKTPIESQGRAYTPIGKAQFLSEDAGQIKLKASGPGWLILKDRNMPGWTAKIDGKEATLTGGIWRELELTAGEHEIEMNYVPPGYVRGLMAAALGWLLLIGLAAWRPR